MPRDVLYSHTNGTDTLYAQPQAAAWSATGIVAGDDTAQDSVYLFEDLADDVEYWIRKQSGGSPAEGDVIVGAVGKNVMQSQLPKTPTIERVLGDEDAIRFSWPVDGVTITGQVSKAGGSYTNVTGEISQRSDEGSVHWYQLAYNAADRQLGSQRYRFTDGTYTRYVNLLVNPASAEVDLDPVLDKLPESGRAATQASVDTIDTVVDAIKLKTDNLPADPADASDINDAFNAIASGILTLATKTDLGASETTITNAIANVAVDLGSVLSKLPETGRASSHTTADVWSHVLTPGTEAGDAITGLYASMNALTARLSVETIVSGVVAGTPTTNQITIPDAIDVQIDDFVSLDESLYGRVTAVSGNTLTLDFDHGGSSPANFVITRLIIRAQTATDFNPSTIIEALKSDETFVTLTQNAAAGKTAAEFVRDDQLVSDRLAKLDRDLASVADVQVTLPAPEVTVNPTTLDVNERDAIAAAVSQSLGDVGITEEDKQDIAASVWDRLLTSLTAAGSIGKKFADWVVGGVADGAIKASSFDQTTAFPLTAADTDDTAVARKGPLDRTLSSLQTATIGAGLTKFVVQIRVCDDNAVPIPFCRCVITTANDPQQRVVYAEGFTNPAAYFEFPGFEGRFYLWRNKDGYQFNDPVIIDVGESGQLTQSQ